MFTVTETGKQTPFTKKYDTEYIFREPLLDYNINYDQGKKDEVTVVDVNDNKIEISRLITRLTPHFVLTQSPLKYTPLSLRNCIEPIKNLLCRRVIVLTVTLTVTLTQLVLWKKYLEM